MARRPRPSAGSSVPAGPFDYGGDSRDAFQSLKPGRAHVGGFFMKRLEVTFGEYLDFFNSTDLTIDPTDFRAVVSESSRFLAELGIESPDTTAILAPRSSRGESYFNWNNAEKIWESRAPPEYPVLGLSMVAALEYVNWRNTRTGGKWRFRLPTDLEWEKAARGADRRIYVWGNDPVWSFCCRGRKLSDEIRNTPQPVGAFPLDQSVYGIRDLDGSVSEPIPAITIPRHIVRRGGHWTAMDDFEFRLATRNGRVYRVHGIDLGIRVVAEIP